MGKVGITILMFVSICVSANEQENIAYAKSFFSNYVALEHSFDSKVSELYSDTAIIRNTRHYPTGQTRVMTFPAPKYKLLVSASMPTAKLRGDTSKYSNCTFKSESNNVRVECTRFSNLKKYSSPISILVGPENGKWLIKEELSESQP
ncbi:hypothetical protein [Alkalimarinus sediminis]|uniref:Uncharacterized protein n=1 Tax=Alkalimarinus sediminis TaxID=1632866 RepID=A0A9E8HHR1_9ALTE|nr:hypothetical protein [Alkalimarinus sediminis]UZW74530.1 hypothetical protein NNL22_16125 [Alkalimarinus sediminis]